MTNYSSALSSIAPARLKRSLSRLLQLVPRAFPSAHEGLPQHNLAGTQVYPIGVNFHKVLADAQKKKFASLRITSETPVASIGSCFAEHFAAHMLKSGFNYPIHEPNAFNASAEWGRVYTIPNLKQIVDYSFDPAYPVYVEQSAKGWFDPLREPSTPFYPTREAAESGIRAHRKASHSAFSTAGVIAITMGQNEGWRDASSGIVWASVPPAECLRREPARYAPERFSYAANLELLSEALRSLLAANAQLRVILTVSPVPSFATFLDSDVIARSFENKCILRTVVDSALAVDPARVFYFPSFELVLCYNPTNYLADNRHVNGAVVESVFGMFDQTVLDRR